MRLAAQRLTTARGTVTSDQLFPSIDVHLLPEDTQRALADDVRTGLSA